MRPMRTIVSKLRRKLGDDADNPTYIFTEPRVGYRMPKGGGEGKGGHYSPVRVRLALTALNDPPCYYERFGFLVTAGLTLPNGIPLWGMTRQPSLGLGA